jgi:acyl-CoA dehydrogenase
VTNIAMDLTLPTDDLAWKERAREFAETILFPHELALEMNGSLPRATKDALRGAVIEHGFNGINHAREVGGQGCTQLQQTLINEELGKATGALWAVVWR